MDTLEILRLPNGITHDKNRIEVYIPPTEAPDNWPPLEKPEPAVPNPVSTPPAEKTPLRKL